MSTLAELIRAIEEADAPAVRRIVTADPALLFTTDGYGFTPLMHAAMCISRDVSVIRELLDAGADVNRQTSEGYTALHCAIDVNFEANLNSREIIAMLVAAGADLSLRQHYGWTPLLRAVVEGTPVEVDALLEAGANPNDCLPMDTLPAFNAGRTALMAAAADPDKVESLLRAGADPLARAADGTTFLEYTETLLAESSKSEFSNSVRRCQEIARNYARDKQS